MGFVFVLIGLCHLDLQIADIWMCPRADTWFMPQGLPQRQHKKGYLMGSHEVPFCERGRVFVVCFTFTLIW
jgi:hypothetical protein